jgi:hypothetical protein
MKTSQLVRQYKAAMAHIRTPSPDVLFRKSNWNRTNPTSKLAQQVLQAAARLYQPGQVASPMELSREVACSRQNISNIITALRRRNLWPYKGGRVGLIYNKSNGYSSTTRT